MLRQRFQLALFDGGVMLGFYEELADLAAMSEDDGFLGQCAGSEIEKAGRQLKLSTTMSGSDNNA
jgi:hypothetical protein